jgi:hypothetical protein
MKAFYLGANIHQKALDIIESSPDTILIYENRDIPIVSSAVERLETMGRAICISEKVVLSSDTERIVSDDDREQIVSAVLNDFRLFLLRTRFTRFDFDGAFSGLCYFSDIVDYALRFTMKNELDLIYCSYTPHTVEAWVFMRTLEEVGLRIIRLINSPLPWILLPISGLSDNRSKNITINKNIYNYQKIERYLLSLESSYSEAKPYYEKGFKLLSWQKIVSSLAMLKPLNFVKNFEKRLVVSDFQRSVTPLENDSPYAVYFLHYQPEMNTLPEAGLYCDQFQAIQKLASALPSGMKLIVKEHPSTFSKRCDRRWRPRDFYRRISKIPNTQICPAKLDTFQLIDGSQFIASIAGVCLTEAMARGIPAITFYPLRFHYFADDLVIDASSASVSELKLTLEKLSLMRNKISKEKLVNSMKKLVLHGYDGSDDESFIPHSIEQAASNSKKTNCLVIQDVIDGVLI